MTNTITLKDSFEGGVKRMVQMRLDLHRVLMHFQWDHPNDEFISHAGCTVGLSCDYDSDNLELLSCSIKCVARKIHADCFLFGQTISRGNDLSVFAEYAKRKLSTIMVNGHQVEIPKTSNENSTILIRLPLWYLSEIELFDPLPLLAKDRKLYWEFRYFPLPDDGFHGSSPRQFEFPLSLAV